MRPAQRAIQLARALAVAAVTLAVARLALHLLGGFAVALVYHEGPARLVPLALGAVVLLPVAAFVWHRFSASRKGLARSCLLVLGVLDYGTALHLAPGIEVFGVSRPSPGVHAVAASRWLPAVDYQINARGFRGGAWDEAPRAGVGRVAVIGDSFVLGQGVGWDDTLAEQASAQLRRGAPNRNVELLNLGIAGNNLNGYLAVADLAIHKHAARVVVVCLNLPNDLNPWDAQAQFRDGRRPSVYSLLSWMAGPDAAMLAGIALATPDPSRHPRIIQTYSARLAALAATVPGVSILVYSYRGVDPWVAEAFAAAPAVPLISACLPPELLAWFPGDGHPTAAANGHHAARLAPFIARALGWSQAEGAAAPTAIGACRPGGDFAFGPWRPGQDLGGGLGVLRLDPHDHQLTITLQAAGGTLVYDLQQVGPGERQAPYRLGQLQLTFRPSVLPPSRVDQGAAALLQGIRASAGTEPDAGVLQAWLAGTVPASAAATPTEPAR